MRPPAQSLTTATTGTRVAPFMTLSDEATRSFARPFSGCMVETSDRESLPVFLLFESVGGTRHVRFRGLVVPGSPHLDRDEQLSAIWRMEGGERFQNYRAKFTVLDVPVVTRVWIEEILAGDPHTAHAPEAWRDWVRHFRYRALVAPAVSPIRSKDEQLPAAGDTEGWALLRSIYAEFSVQPVLFEKTAVALAQFAVPLPTAMDVTRPSADGGRDASWGDAHWPHSRSGMDHAGAGGQVLSAWTDGGGRQGHVPSRSQGCATATWGSWSRRRTSVVRPTKRSARTVTRSWCSAAGTS